MLASIANKVISSYLGEYLDGTQGAGAIFPSFNFVFCVFLAFHSPHMNPLHRIGFIQLGTKLGVGRDSVYESDSSSVGVGRALSSSHSTRWYVSTSTPSFYVSIFILHAVLQAF
jgi:hypothetical protein